MSMRTIPCMHHNNTSQGVVCEPWLSYSALKGYVVARAKSYPCSSESEKKRTSFPASKKTLEGKEIIIVAFSYL